MLRTPSAVEEDLHLYYTAPPHGNNADTPAVHLHAGYELLISTESTEFTTQLDGRTLHADRPFALLLSPYCVHRILSQRPATAIELHFSTRVLERHAGIATLLSKLLQSKSIALIRPPTQTLSQITALCRQMQMLEDAPYARECLLEALLYLLSEHAPAVRRSSGEHHTTTYISDVIRYVTEHLSERLTVPSLAEAFFVSRDKLNRDFKEYTSVTLGKFISTVRLDRAKELLRSREEHGMSIKDISEACGFESDVYFYSFFKRSVGLTPRQYEERYQRTPRE